MSPPRKVCVVGGGSSGIVAVKALASAGLDVTCFETGSGIGGNWRYDNDNDMSSAYASLHINTSKTQMAYSGFPMPESYPDYPGHAEILAYFEDYVDQFGIRDRIRFETEVADIAPTHDDGWSVTTRGRDGVERTGRYDAVLVANGHHWKERWPDYAGELVPRVEVMHAHRYRTPGFLADKNVLVVGIGNSAVDIACEACRVAKRTMLSTRRGAYIFPKYVLGKPTDLLVDPRMSALPWSIQKAIARTVLFVARGNQASYGVPEPDYDIHQAHPTISDDLLTSVGHGRIAMKPDVERLEGDSVRFVDGTTEPVDVVLYCTGYEIAFPFFRDALFSVEGNDVRLYRRVVHPELEHLYFVGLVQPLGAIMPLAEQQSHWVAGLLTGEMKLPTREQMAREIAAYRRGLEERYVRSPRHTIQVDFHPYLHELEREMRDGRARARGGARGFWSARPWSRLRRA